jgi:hypothetical protein
MSGISRVHGSAAAGGFYGLQPTILLIANTAANVGTADTEDANGKITAFGNFGKAITGLQTMASIVFVGPRANGGFCVFVDGATANPYLTANTNTDVAAAAVAAIEAATGLTDVTVTVKTLTFADFA